MNEEKWHHAKKVQNCQLRITLIFELGSRLLYVHWECNQGAEHEQLELADTKDELVAGMQNSQGLIKDCLTA